MKVFKFGGASVKDAAAVRNVARILSLFPGEKHTVIISAMGKTTNAMEKIVQALWEGDKSHYLELVEERWQFHYKIMNELFSGPHYSIYQEVEGVFTKLRNKFNRDHSENFDYEYDQIVSQGEVISTLIVSAFLKEEEYSVAWADARKLIRTSHLYREGKVDWNITENLISTHFLPIFKEVDIQITQGFIGHTSEGFTTTLGREGSDYTAGIFAYCCDALSVTIWKDVPGMLNADPKWFDNTVKLDQISFKEAIELAYYGATVIHPKTIKPLQNKGIPLFVKSFLNPDAEGTIVQESTESDHLIPSFIFKMNQLFLHFTPKDFSFIVEENLSDIFDRLAKINAKINLMQNSALSFAVVLDQDKIDLEKIIEIFEEHYTIKYSEGLELVTVRHFDDATIQRVTDRKETLVVQKTKETARFLLRDLGPTV
jgi:aspartate kinase